MLCTALNRHKHKPGSDNEAATTTTPAEKSPAESEVTFVETLLLRGTPKAKKTANEAEVIEKQFPTFVSLSEPVLACWLVGLVDEREIVS